MKKLLLITIAFISTSSWALAQAPGVIALYSDTVTADCNLYDQGTGVIKVYVIHEQTLGATGCRFRVERFGSTLMWIGDTSPYSLVIGNSETGVSIGYGGCVAGPNHVMTITYIGYGTSDVCSQLAVVPDPEADPPGIHVSDCSAPNPVIQVGLGCGLTINPDSTCVCNPGDCVGRWTEVVVTTEPPGLQILGDGRSYTAPRALYWDDGTTHEIGVNSPQTQADTLYEFSHWSDGGAINHTISVTETDTTFTASFFEYPPPRITITTEPPGLEMRVDYSYYTFPEAFNWLVGSSHFVSVYANQTLGDTICEFSHWSDGGEREHTIVTPYVDSTFTAHFTTIPPAHVTITSDPPGLEVIVDGTPGLAPQIFDWMVGTYHYINVNSPQIRGDTLYEFVIWSNGETGPHSFYTPNADTTITAIFSVSPLREITINTNPPGLEIVADYTTYTSPQIFEWWEGKQHTISVPYSQLVSDSIYIFSNWSDGGERTHAIIVPDSNAAYTAYYGPALPYAVIDSIVDVPEDQGGWVRVYFKRSGYDIPEEPAYPISTYNIWQRMDDETVVQSVLREGNEKGTGGLLDIPVVEWRDRYFLFASPGNQEAGFPSGTWEIVGSFAAAQQDQYIYRVSTRADTSANEIPYSVYLVSAHTTTPSVWFTSPPDSGYSVDNLAPVTPRGFEGRYDYPPDLLTLSWQPNPEPDLYEYRVYRGEGADFDPSGNLVISTVNTTVTGLAFAPVEPWHFKLSAVDIHGNESGFALLPPELIAVPALISSFSSTWNDNAVEIVWELSEPIIDLDFVVYRKTGGNGTYRAIDCNIIENGQRFSFRDGAVSSGMKYTYRVVVTRNGRETASFETTISTPVSVLTLHQNYPNPFNPMTTISFTFPEASAVNLSIFNPEGKLVKTLVNGKLQEGYKEVTWDGRDMRGNPVSTGVYLYRLETKEKALTKKMILIK